jgi:hypothetical protein
LTQSILDISNIINFSLEVVLTMLLDPLVISAAVVAVVMTTTVVVLMHMSKPEKEDDEPEHTLEPIDQASG